MTQPSEADASAPGNTYLLMKRPLESELGCSKFWTRRCGVPDEVLELPALPESSYLENEDAVVRKQVVHLIKECRVATDTDMLKPEPDA
jgi:hypothetical protein